MTSSRCCLVPLMVIACLAALLSSRSLSQANDEKMDQKSMDSYSLGYEFGAHAKKQPVEFDLDRILAGVRDAYEGKSPRLSEEEMKQVLGTLKKKIWTAQQLKYQELASKNLREGEDFLAANAKKDGVVTLPSGLQYRVLREGSGPVPKVTDSVKVRYRGTLVDGTQFDDSSARGDASSIHVAGVMPGWTEALQLMKVGSTWQLFVPAKLAYGERPNGKIPPQSALIFELELLSIETKPAPLVLRPKPEAKKSVEGSGPQDPVVGTDH